MGVAADNPATYKVICVRSSGERIVISTHASRESARMAASLSRNCLGYSAIRIENGRRRRRRRMRRVM